MLRLCPGDNLGVRYVLSAWLIDAGRDDDLDALFKMYPGDGDAGWSRRDVPRAHRGAQCRGADPGSMLVAPGPRISTAPFRFAPRCGASGERGRVDKSAVTV
jgi:hypothetical protein